MRIYALLERRTIITRIFKVLCARFGLDMTDNSVYTYGFFSSEFSVLPKRGRFQNAPG